jgi:hypothetical protein
MRKIVSRKELRDAFVEELINRSLVSPTQADFCKISVTPLVEPDSEGVNWTNATFSALNLDSIDINPVIASLRSKFNVDFSKQ